ncbi:MAG: hypothetical protein BGP16_00905 [Sphingobium sp. 66-54]|nr:MAG: hypothetical protein BGP16_00905 [Sphingobium sp. 66-54]
MIQTSGEGQNSYITLSEANAILMTTQTSFFEVGDQFETGEEAYLIEAFRDLERLWDWAGQPATMDQSAQWPRKYVPKPGWQVPGEPGWSVPENNAFEWIAYKERYLTGGVQSASFISADTVPLDIKEAQALIAMLRKSGSNLVEDNQGGFQGTQLGKIKLSYVNAVRESADIHKRTGHFGRFKAGLLMGV